MPQVSGRDHTKGRRKFFSAAAGSILGGLALPVLIRNFLLARKREKAGGSVAVRINPLAVPRRGKDERSHGS